MQSSKLPITGPCPIDLDAIGFDRSSRAAHCTHCDKRVHNLSNMTQAEARAFLREVAGQKLCVSYARDAAGTIVFKQPEPEVVPVARLRPRRAAALAVPGLGLAAALAACTPVDHPDVQKPRIERTEPKPADELVQGRLEAPKPEVHEVMAGLAPIPEDPQPPEAGDVVVPQDMVDGEIEAPPVDMIVGEIAVPMPEQSWDDDGWNKLPEPPIRGKAKAARGLDRLGEAR